MPTLADATVRAQAAIQQRNRERQAVLQVWATRLQGQAERAHPWTNRTGAAERGLFGRLQVHRTTRRTVYDLILGSHQPADYTLRRSERIFHGFHLEVSHAARWAVIRPTLDREWPSLRRDAQRAAIN